MMERKLSDKGGGSFNYFTGKKIVGGKNRVDRAKGLKARDGATRLDKYSCGGRKTF